VEERRGCRKLSLGWTKQRQQVCWTSRFLDRALMTTNRDFDWSFFFLAEPVGPFGMTVFVRAEVGEIIALGTKRFRDSCDVIKRSKGGLVVMIWKLGGFILHSHVPGRSLQELDSAKNDVFNPGKRYVAFLSGQSGLSETDVRLGRVLDSGSSEAGFSVVSVWRPTRRCRSGKAHYCASRPFASALARALLVQNLRYQCNLWVPWRHDDRDREKRPSGLVARDRRRPLWGCPRRCFPYRQATGCTPRSAD